MPEAADPSQWIFTLFQQNILRSLFCERENQELPERMQNLREPEHLFRTTAPPDVLIPPRTRHESENLSSLKDSPTPRA